MKKGMAALTIILSVLIASVVVWATLSIFFSGTENAGNTLSNLTACESDLWKQSVLANDAEGATCAVKADCSDQAKGSLYIPLGSHGCPEGMYCCLVIPLENTKTRTVQGEDVVGGEEGEEYLTVTTKLDSTIILPEVKNKQQFRKELLRGKHILVDGPEGYDCKIHVKIAAWDEVGLGGDTLERYSKEYGCDLNEPLDQDNLFDYTPVPGKKHWVEITISIYEPGGPSYGAEFMPFGGSYLTRGATYYLEII